MSRRMSFPLTLAGLLGAAAAALGQPPAPPVRDAAWSFSVSRPAAEPQPVQPAGHAAPAVAPPPRAANTARLERRLHLDDTFSRTARTATVVLTAQPPCCATACCETACPAPAAGGPVQLVMAGPVVPQVAVAVRTAAAAYRPLGTWYKEVPGVVVSMTFSPDGDALTAKVTANHEGTTATVTLTADCTITKDGTVHGVVTGGDVEVGGGKELHGADRDSLGAVVQALVDQPFSFRCRPADGGLMVGGVKVAAGKPVPADLVPPEGLLTGKFRHAADGKVPAPKLLPQAERASTPTSALPCPDTLERIGVDFSVNPPVSVRCVGPACPVPAAAGVSFVTPLAPCPAPPAGVQAIMARTLDEMMNGPQMARAPGYNGVMMATGERLPYSPPAVASALPLTACPAPVMLPQPCPVPAPPVAVAPVTYTVPPPMPVPTVAVVSAPARADGLPVGTWCREFGPMRTTLAVRDGTVTMTATLTAEAEGKTFTQGLVVTADCYPTRDGLVGVVTGADLVLDGDLPNSKPDELAKAAADFGKATKALCGQPFALACRTVDGCLMVSNVRLSAGGAWDAGAADGLADGSFLAGQYKPAGEKAAKPVAVWTAGMTLPSGLERYPQYFPPDPAFPLPRELDLQVVTIERCEVAPEPRPAVRAAACEHACPTTGACPAGVRAYVDGPAKMTVADVMTLARAGLADDVIVTQIEVTGSRFALTTADLVALKRAGVSDRVIVAMQIGCTTPPQHPTPERIHGGVLYQADPNVRMKELLYQSEDLRQMGEEWRRFWFRDQPSHLTPERIHGGIIRNTDPAAREQMFSFSLGLLHGGR